MAYPKPLSEKSLARLYQQSGLSQEQSMYLHSLFQACANLYGAVPLRVVWDVYHGQSSAPKLRRKDIISFSEIARRETLPYYIFEIDELYSEEKRADLSREIVSKELVGFGYGRLAHYYRLMESLRQELYYIPGDILPFASRQPSKEEAKLLTFLNELTVTSEQCCPRYGKPYPCVNRGKRLKEFSFLNHDERFEEEYLTKNHSALLSFRESVAGTEAEKILRKYCQSENINSLEFNYHLENIMEELEEVGVELSTRQTHELIQLLTDYHNNSHLWCLCGWTSSDLARQYKPSMPTSIAFGPNMQKMFSDGTMDRNEIVRELQKMGVDVLEEHMK